MAQAKVYTTTSDRLTTVLSYGTLILLGYLVFLIVLPFIVPLAWSAVFAIFFYPVYERLEKRFSPTISALICTIGVTLLLILPVLLVFLYATRQAVDATARIQTVVNSGTAPVSTEVVEWARAKLPESLQSVDFLGYLRQGAEKVASFLASKFGALVKNLFSFFVNLFILLFALFFMFRDGRKILHAVRHLMPFERELQDDMLKESGDLIFSIVAVVGSALIWVPAAIWLILTGHWGKAVLVLAICGGVAGVADNLVRPLLLRNRTRLNDLLLFISILGGLDVFGLLGLVAGPTIVAAALGVFQVYMNSRDETERKREPVEGKA